jgi:hypothetical protein
MLGRPDSLQQVDNKRLDTFGTIWNIPVTLLNIAMAEYEEDQRGFVQRTGR